MKINAFVLILLLTAAVGLSGCWTPKDVTATRVNNTSGTSTTPQADTSPGSSNTKMENKNAGISTPNNSQNVKKSSGFMANLPSNFQVPTDAVGLKLLGEYGSMCIAAGGATAPSKVLFRDESEVSAFQMSLQKSSDTIGGFNVELQAAAMDALKKAITEARQTGKNITPRGADSAKRTYSETVKLWESRVNPGLDHWVSKGKLSASEASRIKSLAPSEQVPEILKLESQSLYFSKDFSKSILYSVAAPGASQHIFMLALDIEQFADPGVREILARHGWFQTVQSDLPHFTYLGVSESELASKGLKSVAVSGHKFWVPNL
jgi:hypothetical protein